MNKYRQHTKDKYNNYMHGTHKNVSYKLGWRRKDNFKKNQVAES